MAASYEQLRSKLEQHRAKLQAELAEARSVTGDGMGYSTHQADHASQAFEQAADLAMRQNAEHLLYKVERALQRMDEGTYGICRVCGDPIDRARLEAIPWARTCMSCAQQTEEL